MIAVDGNDRRSTIDDRMNDRRRTIDGRFKNDRRRTIDGRFRNNFNTFCKHEVCYNIFSCGSEKYFSLFEKKEKVADFGLRERSPVNFF